MPQSAGNTLSDLFDDFGKEQSVEFSQVLKLNDRFREGIELGRWDAILHRCLTRLKHLDSFANEEDLLAKGRRYVRCWQH